MPDRELYCDTCDDVVLFEAPPADDDVRHAEPEWSELACTRCGAALLVATFAVHAPRPQQPRHGRRPVHRRAA